MSGDEEGRECWCGMDHRYLDYDADGNPLDVRDLEDDEEDDDA